MRGDLVQPVVGVPVRVAPEVLQVGLVPHLDRPVPYPVAPVPVDEVRDRGPDQVRPLGPGPRRGDVAAPPEDGLRPRSEPGRHEAQLHEGRDAEVEIGIDNLVDVRERVPHVARAAVLVRPVDTDPVAEQPVPPDVPETDVPLDQGQRLLVVLPQSQLEPAGAHAEPPRVGEPSARLVGNGHPHRDSSTSDGPAVPDEPTGTAGPDQWVSRVPSCSGRTPSGRPPCTGPCSCP